MKTTSERVLPAEAGTRAAVRPLALVDYYHEWPGVGDAADGAGVALKDINGDGILDVIFMANDVGNPSNNFRYYVAYTMGTNGEPAYVGPTQIVPGMGNAAQGAGIALGDIDRNGVTDMLLMHYDIGNGLNEFRYKIGWNLNSSAVPTSWSAHIHIPGLGNDARGANVALADLDNNGILELIFVHHDAVSTELRYKIGKDISTSGVATSWSNPASPPPFASTLIPGQAGVGFVKLSGDTFYRGVVMAYDRYYPNQNQPLSFYFRFTQAYMTPTGPSLGGRPHNRMGKSNFDWRHGLLFRRCRAGVRRHQPKWNSRHPANDV